MDWGMSSVDGAAEGISLAPASAAIPRFHCPAALPAACRSGTAPACWRSWQPCTMCGPLAWASTAGCWPFGWAAWRPRGCGPLSPCGYLVTLWPWHAVRRGRNCSPDGSAGGWHLPRRQHSVAAGAKPVAGTTASRQSLSPALRLCSYIAYIFTQGAEPAQTGSWRPRFRGWPLWRWLAAYFPATLHKTAELPPGRPCELTVSAAKAPTAWGVRMAGSTAAGCRSYRPGVCHACTLPCAGIPRS